jgi:hypothetical protein
MTNQIYYCANDDGNHYWTANGLIYEKTKAAWPEYQCRPMMRAEMMDAWATHDSTGATIMLDGYTIFNSIQGDLGWEPFKPVYPQEANPAIKQVGVTLEELLEADDE